MKRLTYILMLSITGVLFAAGFPASLNSTALAQEPPYYEPLPFTNNIPLGEQPPTSVVNNYYYQVDPAPPQPGISTYVVVGSPGWLFWWDWELFPSPHWARHYYENDYDWDHHPYWEHHEHHGEWAHERHGDWDHRRDWDRHGDRGRGYGGDRSDGRRNVSDRREGGPAVGHRPNGEHQRAPAVRGNPHRQANHRAVRERSKARPPEEGGKRKKPH